jgi:hypothetical protein
VRQSWALVALVILVVPTTAQGEVMDKEPTVSLIWAWAIFAGVLGALVWSIRWWLGVAVSAAVGLMFFSHWLEVSDAHVGPALRQEGGPAYLWNSAAATVAAAGLHAIGAIIGYRRRMRR